MSKRLAILAGLAAGGVLLALGQKSQGVVSGDLAMLALAEAKLDLARGIKEEGGYNDGPAIEAYAQPLGLHAPISWCAAAYSAWVRRASKQLGIEPPPVGSALAQEVMRQFMALGRFIPVEQAVDADLTPGTTVIWSRLPNPSWQGHIGIITAHTPGSDTFETIEGNSGPQGDRVALMVRSLSGYAGHDILGFGKLSGSTDYATSPVTRQRYLLDDEQHPLRYIA